MKQTFNYLHGFHAHVATEAVEGALPAHRNSPQQVPFGLYAEQLSGTAFTSPRHLNLFSWLYRIRPSVAHGEFAPYQQNPLFTSPDATVTTPPTQMRWNPMSYPDKALHFIDSLVTYAAHGSVGEHGAAIHLYCATTDMQDVYFYNADGELLIVPQEGGLLCRTEMGTLVVNVGEIIVIPRGVKFSMQLTDIRARGYVLENFGMPLRLPELGVIGANGLANQQDFLMPTAAYEDRQGEFSLLTKFQGQLWRASLDYSPLNVVAWRGNYAPYKYDLRLFNTMGSVSFDHPDPSIFTVLTSPSALPGIANVDFVIFPARWMVTSDTFRPPYYHRNIMSEYMGLIYGRYDAKQNGFVPGGSSLHNGMSAHGPDAEAYHKGISADLKPEFYDDTLAFMFESKQVWRLTKAAMNAPERQKDYLSCWSGLTPQFEVK